MGLIKKLLLTIIINIAAVIMAVQVIPGINYSSGIQGLLSIAIVMAGVNILVKPILKLLALPVEIATIGLATVLINTAMLLMVVELLPEFTIDGFPFPGVNIAGFLIPPFHLPTWGTAVSAAILISLTSTFLHWVSRK